jgi:hypothetical protein
MTKLVKKLRRIIRTDGLYNYVQLVKQAQDYKPEYVQEKFGLTKEEFLSILVREFNVAVGYQESIDDFLLKLKNIPGYGLSIVEDRKSKSSI